MTIDSRLLTLDYPWPSLYIIDTLIRREHILCQFEWVPGYLFHPMTSAQGEQRDEWPDLEEEADVAAELGFDAIYIDSVPFIDRPGIRFDSQAKFHPRKYLLGLLGPAEAPLPEFRTKRGDAAPLHLVASEDEQ